MNPKKMITVSRQISNSTTVFITDNNNQKCFLSSKFSYYHDFWRVMWLWKLD